MNSKFKKVANVFMVIAAILTALGTILFLVYPAFKF